MNNLEQFLYSTKNTHEDDYVIWMAFPGVYSFSLSSLGYLWMFKTLDEIEGISIDKE